MGISTPNRILLLVCAGVLVVSRSQAQTYATGTVTGAVVDIPLLGPGPQYGISRSGGGFSTVGNPGAIGSSETTSFYYAGTIKTTSGTPSGAGASTILGASETTPAVLRANKTLDVLIGLAGSASYIQFRFASGVSAGTPVLIRLKEKPERMTTLNLALLGTLGLAANNLLAGDVYTGALQPINFPGTPILYLDKDVRQLTGTRLAGTVTRLLIDKAGEWYVMVVPTSGSSFNSVRLKVQFPDDIPVVSAANSVSVRVYHAFTETPGGACSVRPRFTDEGEAAGITLNTGAVADLLQLSQIVANPHLAIDDLPDTYSAISSGLVNVGALHTISQRFYFDHVAGAAAGVRVRLALHNSLVQLGLLPLNGIKFYAYKGASETPVYTGGLGDILSLLGLNLLHLVNLGPDHRSLDLVFRPGAEFDRVKVVYDAGLLGLGVVEDALRIYDVSLAPDVPVLTAGPGHVEVCEGQAATFTVNASGTVTSYQWQEFNGSAWTNTGGNASSFTVANPSVSMDRYRYRSIVTGGNAGCPQNITSGEGELLVLPRPSSPPVQIQP